MKKYPLFLICLILLLYGCATAPQLEMYESLYLDTEEAMDIDSSIQIPNVELFISAPFEQDFDGEGINNKHLAVPVEAVPDLIIEEEISTTEIAEEKESLRVSKPVSEIIVEVNNTPVVESLQFSKEPDKIIEENIEPEIVVNESENMIIEELTINSGEDILIKLDREGWIFDKSNSPSSVKLKKREFKNNQTWFLFSINDSGVYQLEFNLQNLSNGKEDKAQYHININNPSESSPAAIVINPLDENESVDNRDVSDISMSIEEENIPELISSFDDLFDEKMPLDSSQLSDAFGLLEKQGGYDQYLVEIAEYVFKIYPYDNLSAELLYKAAQSIEKPGPLQNIEKALSLFKLVRDYFPISIYCDKSEERIRYLERHFMKIY